MGGGSSQQTYQVPWKLITPQEPVKEGLAVYWFPTGKAEVEKSSLRESRTLQLYSQQCVTMGIVDVQSALGQKYVPDGKLPVAVLVQADGTVVTKLENQNGKLKVGDLEKLVRRVCLQRRKQWRDRRVGAGQDGIDRRRQLQRLHPDLIAGSSRSLGGRRECQRRYVHLFRSEQRQLRRQAHSTS